MALEVYLRNDISAGIMSVAAAMLSAAAAHGGGNIEYCRGVLDTARAQALAFGVPWTELSGRLRGVLTESGREDLLEAMAASLPTAHPMAAD
jgi:hypothetical protein